MPVIGDEVQTDVLNSDNSTSGPQKDARLGPFAELKKNRTGAGGLFPIMGKKHKGGHTAEKPTWKERSEELTTFNKVE